MTRSLMATALAIALACNLVAAAPTYELLRQVCANERIYLTPDQVKQLADENDMTADSESAEQICPQKYRPSVAALHKVVLAGNDDICSQEKADAISDYFEKYILDPEKKAPRSVGMWYIAYGMKVSKACRRRMVNLIAETPKLMSVDEQGEFDIWTNASSLMSNLFDEPRDYDDLVLPKSLNKFLRVKPEKVFIQTVTGEKIKRLQVICQRRWSSIYKPLIAPLITLSEVGFNFRDEKEEREKKLNELVYKWYRAVFLCETLDNMVILGEPEAEEGSASERSLIKVLTKKEVDELPERDQLLEQLATGFPEIEPLDYSPAKEHDAQVSEPVVDISNNALVNAVINFKTTRKGSANFIEKMFNQVRNKVSKGLVKFAASRANIPNANELIKFLDEYENKLSAAGESAVAYSTGDNIARGIAYSVLFVLFAALTVLFILYCIHGGGGGAAAGWAYIHFFG